MEERKKISAPSSIVQLGIAGAIFLLLLSAYIMQVNASSTKAYALRDATRTHEGLVRSQSRLTAEIGRLRSLSSILERKAFLDLVPVEEIVYVHGSLENTVALH